MSAQAQSPDSTGAALHLADQRLPEARLIDITESGELTFYLGDKNSVTTRTFPANQIVRWGWQRAGGAPTLVWLADGSWLAGQIQWKSEQAFELVSDWFAPLELQTSQVRGLVFHPSPSIKRFAELEKQMLRATGSADVVWNSRSEQLSGVLTLKLRAAVEPQLPPNTVWLLKTNLATEPIELESDAVQAVVFSPILRRPIRPSTAAVRIDLRDGSQLNVIALRRNAQRRVAITLADNRVVETLDNSLQFTSAITRVTGEPDRIVWLDGLEPARYRYAETPGELTWPLGRNEDLFGQPLWVTGEAVVHGVAMHAPSQAAYRWNGRPGKFLAEVSLYGISSGLPSPVGSAECKVLLARQGKLVEVFRSPVLRATSPGVPVEVDVNDSQLVVLLVEQADQGPFGDHVLWREARVVPASDAPAPK